MGGESSGASASTAVGEDVAIKKNRQEDEIMSARCQWVPPSRFGCFHPVSQLPSVSVVSLGNEDEDNGLEESRGRAAEQERERHRQRQLKKKPV